VSSWCILVPEFNKCSQQLFRHMHSMLFCNGHEREPKHWHASGLMLNYQQVQQEA
jgi:hypothetical protein